MEITGTQQVPAARDAVWNALNDAAVLKQCLPGCESVERTSPEEFKVVMAAAIGPLRARFNGTLRITEAHPPESCVMVFEGQGGAVGFGKGSSSVTLREAPGGTELTYSARAQVGGKLAQVGSRLIDNVARKMADDFFKAFRAQLAPLQDGAVAPVTPVAAAVVTSRAGTPAMPAPAAGPASANIASATLSGAAPATASAQVQGVTVPGWWLAMAAAIGSGATLAGSLFAR